jgi:hypothetical protein
VTIYRALAYLRNAAGVAWRTLKGRPCACDTCRGHRAFIRESATAYRAEVRSLDRRPRGGKPS